MRRDASGPQLRTLFLRDAHSVLEPIGKVGARHGLPGPIREQAHLRRFVELLQPSANLPGGAGSSRSAPASMFDGR